MRLKGVVLGLAVCVFCSTIPPIHVSAKPPYLKVYDELVETNAEFVDYDPLTDTIIYTSEAGAAHSDKVFQTIGFEMARVIQRGAQKFPSLNKEDTNRYEKGISTYDGSNHAYSMW